MADYFTQFSCILDVGSAENARNALVLRDRLVTELEEEEGCGLGFDLSIEPGKDGSELWISSDDCGDPEHVITFVLRCAEAFNLTGRWGFAWALSCSKPRLDAFGGGAQVIDLAERRSIGWLDCDHWLAHCLDTTTEVDPIASCAAATSSLV